MATIPRAMPRLDATNRPFWTGGAKQQLLILRCEDCSGFIHPPVPLCRHCRSERIVPYPVSGDGVVDTYTVNYQKWHPALEVPYVIARIALDGAPGVYLTSNVVGCDPETVDVGDRVRVSFLQQGEVYLPLFEKLPA